MARRPRSLLLSFTDAATVDGPILRTEVLTALIDIGIKKEEIEGIEAPQRLKYYVVFNLLQTRRLYMDKQITLREKRFKLEHPDPRPYRAPKTRLKIYNYPIDENVDHLEKVLKHYGDFRSGSIKDLEDRSCGIKNGIKELYLNINKKIPSYIYVGKYLTRFDYLGQSQTCRKCHKIGHIAKECTTEVLCKGCGADDHERATCPHVICFHCGKEGHTISYCFEKYDEEYPDLNATNNKDEETPSETETVTGFKPFGTWEEPTETDKDTEEENTEKMEEDQTEKQPMEKAETETETETKTETETEIRIKTTSTETETEAKKGKAPDETLKESGEEIIKKKKEEKEKEKDKSKDKESEKEPIEITSGDAETEKDVETGKELTKDTSNQSEPMEQTEEEKKEQPEDLTEIVPLPESDSGSDSTPDENKGNENTNTNTKGKRKRKSRRSNNKKAIVIEGGTRFFRSNAGSTKNKGKNKKQ